MNPEFKNIGKLGFGLMRLPKDDSGAIDIAQSSQMVDMFLNAGFTYFDTAWSYDGSEEATRKILVERYPRESYQLATKCAAWVNCKTREEATAQFDVSLERTGAGYFDFYLLHNLGEDRTRAFDDFDMWSWIIELKAAGKIRYAGFSFHGTAAEIDGLLAAHPEMDFVQLQINYADWEDPAVQSRDCYEAARKHGVPVVIMEPIKGGMLATPPQGVRDVLRAAEPDSSEASWAVRFAASVPGVITVLSGMSSVEQMRDNLSYMKGFTRLSEVQEGVIGKAQEELAKVPLIPCTVCDYCAKVCPVDVGISGTFRATNNLTLYGDLKSARSNEGWFVTKHGHKHATECIECGKCETACPQKIAIREELKRCIEKLQLGE